MNEILKSETFKTVYAIAVFVISLFLTVKVYRKDIDVESYKMASCGVAASLLMYIFYLTMR